MWLPLTHLLQGTWLATQACALTGNRTGDLSVCTLTLNPLSYNRPGQDVLLKGCMLLQKRTHLSTEWLRASGAHPPFGVGGAEQRQGKLGEGTVPSGWKARQSQGYLGQGASVWVPVVGQAPPIRAGSGKVLCPLPGQQLSRQHPGIQLALPSS